MCNWWLRYPDDQDGHVICLFLYFRGPWIQWWHLLSCTGHHCRDRPHPDIRAFVTYVKFSVNLGSNFRYQWRPSQGICSMTNLTHMCTWWLRYPDGQYGHVICLFLCFRGPWIQWWHPLSCTGHHFGDRPHANIPVFVTYVKFSVNLGSNFRYHWRPSQGICNATLLGQYPKSITYIVAELHNDR